MSTEKPRRVHWGSETHEPTRVHPARHAIARRAILLPTFTKHTFTNHRRIGHPFFVSKMRSQAQHWTETCWTSARRDRPRPRAPPLGRSSPSTSTRTATPSSTTDSFSATEVVYRHDGHLSVERHESAPRSSNDGDRRCFRDQRSQRKSQTPRKFSDASPHHGALRTDANQAPRRSPIQTIDRPRPLCCFSDDVRYS